MVGCFEGFLDKTIKTVYKMSLSYNALINYFVTKKQTSIPD